MIRLPDPSTLSDVVDYNEATGQFFWKPRRQEAFASEGSWRSWNSKHAGKPAFNSPNSSGYHYGRLNGVRLAAHRLAFAFINGRWPEGHIDHINGNPADNRISNLREADHSLNGRNCKRRTDNKSGVTGVFFSGGVYRAEICVRGERINLGRFQSAKEAIAARATAEKENGFHENHGR